MIARFLHRSVHVPMLVAAYGVARYCLPDGTSLELRMVSGGLVFMALYVPVRHQLQKILDREYYAGLAERRRN